MEIEGVLSLLSLQQIRLKSASTSSLKTKLRTDKNQKPDPKIINDDYCKCNKLWSNEDSENYSFFCPSPNASSNAPNNNRHQTIYRHNRKPGTCGKAQKRYSSMETLSLNTQNQSRNLQQSYSCIAKTKQFINQVEEESRFETKAKTRKTSDEVQITVNEKLIKSQSLSLHQRNYAEDQSNQTKVNEKLIKSQSLSLNQRNYAEDQSNQIKVNEKLIKSQSLNFNQHNYAEDKNNHPIPAIVVTHPNEEGKSKINHRIKNRILASSQNCNGVPISKQKQKPEPPPAQPLKKICPCFFPYVAPCACLCPCPRLCSSCARSRSYLPVYSSQDIEALQRPSSTHCTHSNPYLMSNHFWRSLYPTSPHSICSLDSKFQRCNNLKKCCPEPCDCHAFGSMQFSDAQIQTLVSNSNSQTQIGESFSRSRSKLLDAGENKYKELTARVSSATSLDIFDTKVIEFNPRPKKLNVQLEELRNQYQKKSNVPSTTAHNFSSKIQKKKGAPMQFNVLAQLRLKAPMGGLGSTKTTLTLGNRYSHSATNQTIKLGPSSHKNEDAENAAEHDHTHEQSHEHSHEQSHEHSHEQSHEHSHEQSHEHSQEQSHGEKKDKENAPEKQTKGFKYKNVLAKPQAISLVSKLGSAKPRPANNKEHFGHGTARSFIDQEFSKIRANNRPPIVWVYGYTQMNVANAKREVINMLALDRDYYIMNLDYEIKRLRGFNTNTMVNNNRQLTAQIMTRLRFILNKIGGANGLLTPTEVCELIKLAMLTVHLDENPPKGYIIDAFPLDLDEAQVFEKMIWPVSLGLYFLSTAWVEVKTEPPPCVQPKYYVRDKDYYEEDVENTVDFYGFKSIKITYAEHLRGEIIMEFLQFMQAVLVKNIMNINGQNKKQEVDELSL